MLFQNKDKNLLAVANGTAVSLSEVPDEAFSSGILGVGLAIRPSDGTIYSPVSGTVESITETRHAYTLLSDDGLDILIHIGIDTVELKGEGFLSMVSIGDKVKSGDVIARVDLNILKGGNYPTVIPVLVTNPEILQSYKVRTGSMIGGESTVFQYRLK